MHTKNAKKIGLPTAMRHPFTVDEDTKLLEIMTTIKIINWEHIAANFNGRSARQCRERWAKYLNPAVRIGPWTEEEDKLLLEKVNEMGRCWSSIGKFFNGRSDNDIKNRWYSHLRYKTVEIDGKLKFVCSLSESPFPNRKTRRRVKNSPQQNAIRNLEQIKRKEMVENSIQMQIQQQQNQQFQKLLYQPYSFYNTFEKQQILYNQQMLFRLMQQQQQQSQQLLQLKQKQQMHLNAMQQTNSACSKECKLNDEAEHFDNKCFSFDDLLDQTEFDEPECIDFWEPTLFDEAITNDLPMIPKQEAHASSVF